MVNGSSDREGRIEVYYKSEWGTVCDDDFDIRDADVICRMMGFPGAISAEIEGRFGAGTQASEYCWMTFGAVDMRAPLLLVHFVDGDHMTVITVKMLV